MRPATQAFFLPVGAGQRLCLFHPAQGPLRGCVLHLHGWGEELNKSRRMVARQARQLAQAGQAVLLLDLKGCGDSSGDWLDTTWQDWIDDAVAAAGWLLARHDAPLTLWGHRSGALLASAVARHLPAQVSRLLLWQPVLQGKLQLTQFLRLRAAADMAHTDSKTTMQRLRSALQDGQAIDVAGYQLGAGLARGLEAATLDRPPAGTEVLWLEVSSQAEPALAPASAALAQAWVEAGCQLQARALAGPAFWQTQEIEDADLLLQATLDLMRLPAADTAPA
ncbi:MAG: hydrolase 2, exosortase A system-associated [Burkholderiaceae bacterium]|nr:hydrolase 2, exosortase A system-associated [Burkholderiaceae bacterium]